MVLSLEDIVGLHQYMEKKIFLEKERLKAERCLKQAMMKMQF